MRGNGKGILRQSDLPVVVPEEGADWMDVAYASAPQWIEVYRRKAEECRSEAAREDLHEHTRQMYAERADGYDALAIGWEEELDGRQQ